ncbi:lysine N(6)-hydroxylase/L-ornithine N(5)-oxygenase family protein [Streptomyces sp. PTY087I2]|uniref:lysine N(6)-hydroxylase/L-ornithine N(5)-oxygenase family protein n=1 Tax=Streptomyces sp. PTY087I2 TaxID=1819298 RepID=UPI0021000477|nr:SidA/IucD/PvdA family monooxygenase [Streptomyces sp. PTY087I2]
MSTRTAAESETGVLRSPGRSDVLDVVGIGFGPSNLALAIALAEHNQEVPEADRVSARFYERKPAFGWHRGMLLKDTTMQVSYLKDLVSMRNPCSRFSFLSYLHARDRLVDFINHKTLFPSRREFHDYLEWSAQPFGDAVDYGREVVDVVPVEEAGEVTHFQVLTRAGGPQAEPTVQRARNVVVAGGLRPRLPDGTSLSDRVWHTSELLDRLETLPAGAARTPRSFTVVGAGQSAAETVAHLHGEFPDADIHAVFARYGYAPADDSAFVNKIFDPEAVDHFYTSPDDVKEMMFDYHRSTNYSVVDIELIDELYRRLYQEKVAGKQRLHVHNLTRLLTADAGDEHVRVGIEFLPTGRQDVLRTDYLVLATGYRPTDLNGILGSAEPILRTDDKGRVCVNRDYSVESILPGPAAIYLQGPTEHSHGIASSLLSNTAVRAGEITKALAKRLVRDIDAPRAPALTAAAPL